MKKYLSLSIFLTTLVFITSFGTRDANADCWRNAYGNVVCDGQSTPYGRQNSGTIPGQVGNLNSMGSTNTICGYDYMGRYTCN